MKSVIVLSVLLSGAAAFSANLPEKCEDLAAQVNAQVISTEVYDLDQNQVECTFKVLVNDAKTELDQVCPIDLSEVELVSYVDPSCSVSIGQQFDHTTTQHFSTRDMQSRGLFYWIDLGGYLSQNVFPNYGK